MGDLKSSLTVVNSHRTSFVEWCFAFVDIRAQLQHAFWILSSSTGWWWSMSPILPISFLLLNHAAKTVIVWLERTSLDVVESFSSFEFITFYMATRIRVWLAVCGTVFYRLNLLVNKSSLLNAENSFKAFII